MIPFVLNNMSFNYLLILRQVCSVMFFKTRVFSVLEIGKYGSRNALTQSMMMQDPEYPHVYD